MMGFMARPLRLIAPDSWQHLTHRGADRQDIFSDDRDRLHYEFLLGELEGRFGVEVHAYCLMTNHVHALVHCVDADLSGAMQYVASTYASRYNRRHERTGPLFGGRFHATAVDSDEQLLAASRYIHRNPISFVSTDALDAYRWSSLAKYVGRRTQPDWVHDETVLSLFGQTRSGYRDYVLQPQPSDKPLRPEPLHASPDEIERAAATAAGITPDELKRTQRGVLNRPRLLAIWMTTQARVVTTEELAARYGLKSPSGVRNAARRARVLLADDAEFARLRDRAEALLRRAA
jgi:REP element-mobilizing transposase RayT